MFCCVEELCCCVPEIPLILRPKYPCNFPKSGLEKIVATLKSHI